MSIDLHVHTKDSDGVMSEHDVVKSATARRTPLRM